GKDRRLPGLVSLALQRCSKLRGKCPREPLGSLRSPRDRAWSASSPRDGCQTPRDPVEADPGVLVDGPEWSSERSRTCQTPRDGAEAASAGRCVVGQVQSAQRAWKSCDAGPVRSGAGELIAAQLVAFF